MTIDHISDDATPPLPPAATKGQRAVGAGIAAGAGAPIGVVFTWFLTNVLHLSMSTEDGAALGSTASAGVVLFGNLFRALFTVVVVYGIAGIWRIIVHGRGYVPPSGATGAPQKPPDTGGQ
jgi:hypothetical protein